MAKNRFRSDSDEKIGQGVTRKGDQYFDSTSGRLLVDNSFFGYDPKVPKDFFEKCLTDIELVPFDDASKALTEEARRVRGKRSDLEYLQFIRRQKFAPKTDSLGLFIPGIGYLHTRGPLSDLYWKGISNWINLNLKKFEGDKAAVDRLAYCNANTAMEAPLRPQIIKNKKFEVPNDLRVPEKIHRAIINRIWLWLSLSVHLTPAEEVKDRVNGLASAGPFRRTAEGEFYSPSDSDIRLYEIGGHSYSKYGVFLLRNTKDYKLSLVNNMDAPFGAWQIHVNRYEKTLQSDGRHYWTPDLIEWGLESGALPMETGGARKNSNDCDITDPSNWANCNGFSKNRKHGQESLKEPYNWEVGKSNNEMANKELRKISPFKGILAIPRTVCAISFQSQAIDKIFAKLLLGLWHNSPGYLPTIRDESVQRRRHFKNSFKNIAILGGDTSNFETFWTSNVDYILGRWPEKFQDIISLASTVAFGNPANDITVVKDILASGEAYTSLDSGVITTIALVIIFLLEAGSYNLNDNGTIAKAIELVDHIFMGTPWVWIHDARNQNVAVQMQGKSDDIYDRLAEEDGRPVCFNFNQEVLDAHNCDLHVTYNGHEGFGLYTAPDGTESFKDSVVINKLTTIYENPGCAPKDAFSFYSKAVLFGRDDIVQEWLDMTFNVGRTDKIRLSNWIPYVQDYIQILAEHGLGVADLVNEFSPSEVAQFAKLENASRGFILGSSVNEDYAISSSRTNPEVIEASRERLIYEAGINPSKEDIISELRSSMSSYYKAYFDVILQQGHNHKYLGEFFGPPPKPVKS